MKIKQKNRGLNVVISIFIFSLIMTNTQFVAKASDMNRNVDLIVLFNNKIDKKVEDIIINSGGKVIDEFQDIGGIEVNCPPDLIPIIKSSNSVESLAPNHIIKLSINEKKEEFIEANDKDANTSSDLYEKYQWDIKRVTNNGESYKLESGNHNVVVGIVDSGVDKGHPDFVNNFLGGKNLVPANFKDDSSETGDINDTSDRIGHGTGVAGIIAANGRTKGIAPNIGFKSYRIFNKDGETSATICSSAIISAANDGVDVINLSISSFDLKGKCYWTNPDTGIKYNMGSNMAEYSLIKRAVKYAIDKGVTVIAASGNENQDCADKLKLTNYLNEVNGDYGFKYDGLAYETPGTVKGVVTVSATGRDDKLASYSNYGNGFIDITAPGGDRSSTHKITDMCYTTSSKSGYTFQEGTSFSTPKVSAVAALIICKEKNLTPKEVAKKIYKTAEKLDKGNSGKYYGAGMVNVYNALK
ncbi:S8 family serine peptidase [Clostridium saccharoperbutylacetonicum]|uniref:S8 family serine peptidase n=1 Tax=Clostridium saccharoperbutylacetonicum TaxID=36745 RepID=UPI0039E9CC3D